MSTANGAPLFWYEMPQDVRDGIVAEAAQRAAEDVAAAILLALKRFAAEREARHASE